MPQHELATFYRVTHNACRYDVKLPSPRMIQELVQAWKQLRKGRGLRRLSVLRFLDFTLCIGRNN